jgi:hypothetical protein
MTKHFLMLLGLALFVLGCGPNVVLDNPRDEAVTFTFDKETSYKLGPGESGEIKLDPGDHHVKIVGRGDTLFGDTTFTMREGGVVHSGGSSYLIWRQLYGLQTDRATLLNEAWVEIDSARAFGDFKVYPPAGLFIEKSWDYGLAEKLPEARTLMVTSDFVVESKVFRTQDFIDAYRAIKDK